jgi:hypothetical protein
VRITPTDALGLLCQDGLEPMPACRKLTEAVHDNLCRLYCEGKEIDPRIAVTLRVEARLNDGRWTAEVVSATREPWDRPVYEEVEQPDGKKAVIMTKPPYEWTLDDDRVKALLPPLPLRAKDKPGSRTQEAIRQIAAEKWPGGYEHVETSDIIELVSPELEERDLRVPHRSTFERALGRRKR